MSKNKNKLIDHSLIHANKRVPLYMPGFFLQQGSFMDARLFLKQNDWPFPNSCKRVPLYKPGFFYKVPLLMHDCSLTQAKAFLN